MKIEPVATDFHSLISSTFVYIPPFQRPYSWKAEQIDELWDDLIGTRSDDYFVGSIVFYQHPKENAGAYVTDGQQRLTTLSIALCALRDLSNDAGFKDIATGLQNLIERRDVDNQRRFFIKYEQSNKYLADRIFSTERSSTQALSDEEKGQRQAYKQLRTRAESYLQQNLGASWVSHDNAAEEIKEIRDAILNISFIKLTLGSQDEAYVVFETLNSRGMDLEVSDLLKNHLTRRIKKSNKDVSPVSVIWEEIRSKFHGLSTSPNFDAFLHHYWLSRVNFVSKKDLFKEMKSRISKPQAAAWLEDLRIRSEPYAKIVSPGDFRWGKEELEVLRSLESFNRFNVQQVRPLVLSILTLHMTNKEVSLKQAKRALRLVENFTFQFNAITQSRGGGGITVMYSNLARTCERVSGAQDFSDFIKEMTQKFKDRDIDREDFVWNFCQLEYSNLFPRNRPLVRYTLQRIHQHFHKSGGVDYDQYSIEHLKPQSSGAPHDIYANIGNLTFVPEELNGNMGDIPFAEKKKTLENENQADPIISEWSEANEREIRHRAEALAHIGFDRIWNL